MISRSGDSSKFEIKRDVFDLQSGQITSGDENHSESSGISKELMKQQIKSMIEKFEEKSDDCEKEQQQSLRSSMETQNLISQINELLNKKSRLNLNSQQEECHDSLNQLSSVDISQNLPPSHQSSETGLFQEVQSQVSYQSSEHQSNVKKLMKDMLNDDQQVPETKKKQQQHYLSMSMKSQYISLEELSNSYRNDSMNRDLDVDSCSSEKKKFSRTNSLTTYSNVLLKNQSSKLSESRCIGELQYQSELSNCQQIKQRAISASQIKYSFKTPDQFSNNQKDISLFSISKASDSDLDNGGTGMSSQGANQNNTSKDNLSEAHQSLVSLKAGKILDNIFKDTRESLYSKSQSNSYLLSDKGTSLDEQQRKNQKKIENHFEIGFDENQRFTLRQRFSSRNNGSPRQHQSSLTAVLQDRKIIGGSERDSLVESRQKNSKFYDLSSKPDKDISLGPISASLAGLINDNADLSNYSQISAINQQLTQHIQKNEQNKNLINDIHSSAAVEINKNSKNTFQSALNSKSYANNGLFTQNNKIGLNSNASMHNNNNNNHVKLGNNIMDDKKLGKEEKMKMLMEIIDKLQSDTERENQQEKKHENGINSEERRFLTQDNDTQESIDSDQLKKLQNYLSQQESHYQEIQSEKSDTSRFPNFNISANNDALKEKSYHQQTKILLEDIDKKYADRLDSGFQKNFNHPQKHQQQQPSRGADSQNEKFERNNNILNQSNMSECSANLEEMIKRFTSDVNRNNLNSSISGSIQSNIFNNIHLKKEKSSLKILGFEKGSNSPEKPQSKKLSQQQEELLVSQLMADAERRQAEHELKLKIQLQEELMREESERMQRPKKLGTIFRKEAPPQEEKPEIEKQVGIAKKANCSVSPYQKSSSTMMKTPEKNSVRQIDTTSSHNNLFRSNHESQNGTKNQFDGLSHNNNINTNSNNSNHKRNQKMGNNDNRTISPLFKRSRVSNSITFQNTNSSSSILRKTLNELKELNNPFINNNRVCVTQTSHSPINNHIQSRENSSEKPLTNFNLINKVKGNKRNSSSENRQSLSGLGSHQTEYDILLMNQIDTMKSNKENNCGFPLCSTQDKICEPQAVSEVESKHLNKPKPGANKNGPGNYIKGTVPGSNSYLKTRTATGSNNFNLIHNKSGHFQQNKQNASFNNNQNLNNNLSNINQNSSHNYNNQSKQFTTNVKINNSKVNQQTSGTKQYSGASNPGYTSQFALRNIVQGNYDSNQIKSRCEDRMTDKHCAMNDSSAYDDNLNHKTDEKLVTAVSKAQINNQNAPNQSSQYETQKESNQRSFQNSTSAITSNVNENQLSKIMQLVQMNPEIFRRALEECQQKNQNYHHAPPPISAVQHKNRNMACPQLDSVDQKNPRLNHQLSVSTFGVHSPPENQNVVFTSASFQSLNDENSSACGQKHYSQKMYDDNNNNFGNNSNMRRDMFFEQNKNVYASNPGKNLSLNIEIEDLTFLNQKYIN